MNSLEKEDYKKVEYRSVGLVGDTSFTMVLPKGYATAIGLEKGDFLKITQDDKKRLIVERAE